MALGEKAVFQPGGVGFDGPVAPTRWQEQEEVVRGVSLILQDAAGSSEAAWSENVIQFGEVESDNFIWDVFMTLWRTFLSSAVQFAYHAVIQYVKTLSMER